MVPTGERRLEPVRRCHHRVRSIGSRCITDRPDGCRVEVGQIARGDDDVAPQVEQRRDHTTQGTLARPPVVDHRVADVGGHGRATDQTRQECIRRRAAPPPP